MRSLRGVTLLLMGIAVIGCSHVGRPAGPRGVILFVGDGMGVATVTAARIHKGAIEGVDPPSAAKLYLDRATRSCLVRTWSADGMVTDSAAGITAMMSGEKVLNKALGARNGPGNVLEILPTLVEVAESRGLSTGVVTTTRLTHATPAGAYAHVADRFEERDIAPAMVPGGANPRLRDGIEVLLGGGRRFFVPEAAGGLRRDGRDLLDELKTANYRVVVSAEELRDATESGAARILGLFSDDNMAFEADRAKSAPTEPSLSEMTKAALEVVRRNPKGYFLLVEGGRIDHAHHVNNAYRAITDMLAFDAAVGATVDAVGDEALIFVTADHDHTMVISGYAPVTEDVFTEAGTDLNGMPYTALLYGNGPAASKPPKASIEPASPKYRQRAGVPLKYETHGGMDVPLYVFAPPGTSIDLPGTIENTEIFHYLKAAMPD